MEIEYKWDMPGEEALPHLIESVSSASGTGEPSEIRMRAVYYDTPAQDIKRLHGGLRIRQENDESVCCLKLAAMSTGGCKARQEFEVAAADINEGLEKLPSAGAPQDVCELLIANGPQPICETDFVRRAYRVKDECFVAEFAVDVGEMRREGRSAPIHEVELELVSGSREAFHAYAQALQEQNGLEVEALSKLARAMAL